MQPDTERNERGSNEPLALQKVNELRSVVSDDSDLAEMVDTLATLLVLKQDMAEPMYGAKVTFYEKPDGERVDIDFAEYKEHVDNGDLLPDDPEEAWEIRTDTDNEVFDCRDDAPWYVRWRRLDGDNDTRIPDGEIEHRFTRYMQWSGVEELDEEDVPAEIREAEEHAAKCRIASERDGEEWTIYRVGSGDDRRTVYKRDKLVPCEEHVGRRAIVVEPHVADQPTGTDFWDPNREEYTTPEDYPMGTVNLVVPSDPDDEFGRDYTNEMAVETSVMPADSEPGETPAGHVYTPGWEPVAEEEE